MRRLESGNLKGAAQQIIARRTAACGCEACAASGKVPPCESACILAESAGASLRISRCMLLKN
jgi:hypothetical protein